MGQFFCKLYKQKEIRVLLQGLDAAGKTTILYHLKLGEVVTTIPTIGFNVETVQHRNLNFTAWDVGGRDKIRPLFRHYYPNTNALIFVVDSNDKERLEQIADEITLALEEEALREAVFLILANKQDLDSALSVEEVKKEINYEKIKANYRGKAINIFGCSAITKEGQQDLVKALDWLCEQLAPKSTPRWSLSSQAPGNSQRTEKDAPSEEDGKIAEEIPGTDLKEKKPWTIGSYVKDTVGSLKKVMPSLW